MKKEGYIELGKILYKKNILPTNINVSSRQINYWKSKNVIPFFEKEKKGFMNIPQAVWMMIINELSNVGIATEKLQNLSHEIWIKPFNEKYADKIFEKEIKNLHSEIDKDVLSGYLNFEPIMITMFRKEMNPFTDAIKNCLISKSSLLSFLYAPRTGEYLINYSNTALTSDLNNFLYKETLITIPFLPLLSKAIGIDLLKSNEDLNYLNSVENHIRRNIFYDKPKFLEIELDYKGTTKVYKITESHKSPEQLAEFFLKNNIPVRTKINIETRLQGNYKITIKS